MADVSLGYREGMSERSQDPGMKPPLAPDPDSAGQPDQSSSSGPEVTELEDIDSGGLADDLEQAPDEKPNAPNRDVDTAAAMPDPDADPWGDGNKREGRPRA
jgi:hypothetical protein